MNKKLIISLFLSLGLAITNLSYGEITEENYEEAANLYNNAIDLYKSDEIEKSIEYFTKALELRPDFYEAHYNLAQILMSLNRYDEAIKSLEIIAKLTPNDTENLYNLGKLYYKKGYLSKLFSFFI